MAPKLYMGETSPAVRAVLLTAKAIGLTLELIPIDFQRGEHLTPEYLKLNPQHTIPTLDDDGVVIWDSHAINVYLVLKYGKDDSLYPKDLQKQATVNQRLHFDSGVLFPAGRKAMGTILNRGEKTVPLEEAEAIIEAYGFLELFLEGHQWMAGDNVTLADLNLIPTVTSSAIVVPIEEEKFPNLVAWVKRAEDLPYYEANRVGLARFKNFISGLLRP